MQDFSPSLFNFKNFLLGKEADFKGRTIQEIWNFSDIQIEENHDFIQLIFPLNKKLMKPLFMTLVILKQV